jgi:hypothetical protein
MNYPIKLNPNHKGKLHRWLGVKQGTTLTHNQLMVAKAAKDPAVRKMATFAINSRKWHH